MFQFPCLHHWEGWSISIMMDKDKHRESRYLPKWEGPGAHSHVGTDKMTRGGETVRERYLVPFHPVVGHGRAELYSWRQWLEMLFGLPVQLHVKGEEEEEVWDLFFLLIPTPNLDSLLLVLEEPEAETLVLTHVLVLPCTSPIPDWDACALKRIFLTPYLQKPPLAPIIWVCHILWIFWVWLWIWLRLTLSPPIQWHHWTSLLYILKY